MRDCSRHYFLTFVLTGLLFATGARGAAPSEPARPPVKTEPIQDVFDPALSQPELRRLGSRILHFNLTSIGGQIAKKWPETSSTGYGATFDWRASDQNFWSVSGRWLSPRALWLEVGKKFLIPSHFDWAPSEWEPYYKLSLSHFLDPDDSLSGLSRIRSFKGSVAFGVLDLGSYGRLFSFEFGGHWGLDGPVLHAQFGMGLDF
jgi:hypothetical protein